MLHTIKRSFPSLLRRQFHFLLFSLCSLFLVVAFSACTASSPSGSGSSDAPAQLRIGYQVIPNAEVLMKAMGLVEKAFPDTNVEWRSFESGRDVNTAMAANGLDLGLIGSTGTSIGLSNQLPYKVYFIHAILGDNEALVVRGNANIKSLNDLKGKKVAVPFGSTTHFSLLAALEKNGIGNNDVTILDMQPPDMLAAWQRGDIDAGFVWQPTLGKMTNSGGALLLTAKTLAQQGVITADMGVAHKDFIQNHPAALKKYVSLLDEAVKFYREKPEEAARTIAPELGLAPEESLQVMNELVWLNSQEQADAKYLGTPEQVGDFAQVLQDSANFMKNQGAIPNVPAIEAFKAGIYTTGLTQ